MTVQFVAYVIVLCYGLYCVTVQFVTYVNVLCDGPMCTKLVVVPILNVLCYCLCCVTNDEIHLKYVLSFNSMPHVLIK